MDARVDTIVPFISWNDLAYSLAPNNTTSPPNASRGTPGVFKKEWTDLLMGLGLASGIFGIPADPGRITGCANFQPKVCEARRQLNHDGYPSEETIAYSRHSSVSSYMSKIRIPTLLVQGEADSLFNLQEAVATYQALKAQGTPVKMIWQSWGHSGGILDARDGEFSLLSGRLTGTYQGERMFAWCKRYLRDADVSTGPEFAYYRDWAASDDSAEGAYGTANQYPAGNIRRLYLSGRDDLVTSASQVRSGSDSYQNWALGIATSHTETSGVDGLIVPPGIIPPYDLPGTHAAYTTEPLAANTDVVGSPALTLEVSSSKAAATQRSGDGGRLVMFVKLFDVAPNGGQTLVNRLISPVRVPDVSEPFRVTLPGVAHRFAAGHRLKLVIAASDTAYANNSSVLPVTIANGSGTANVLEVPVVQG
jgi:putative CocE/NonD family hydrolase